MGTPPLYAVQEFIAALAAATDGKCTLPNQENSARKPNVLADGRIIFTHKSSYDQSTPEIQVKYQSLNPAPQFREVVDAARSVILAGGTMSPVETNFKTCYRLICSSIGCNRCQTLLVNSLRICRAQR